MSFGMTEAPLAQPHACDVEQQFRLPITAKHEPRDDNDGDKSERMPNETARQTVHAAEFTLVRSPVASCRSAFPRRRAARLRRASRR